MNYFDSQPGDQIILNNVLYVRNGKEMIKGHPTIDKVSAHGTVLCHRRGKKSICYKMLPKKHKRVKNGYRVKQTRILVDAIVYNP